MMKDWKRNQTIFIDKGNKEKNQTHNYEFVCF